MTVVATRENGYLVLKLNAKTNAFSNALFDELNIWLDRAKTDREVYAIILTSQSRIFSVGGDIMQMKEGVESGDLPKYVREMVPKINEVIYKLVSHPLPIITVLNGTAAGGGIGLFLAGDYRIAAEGTKLALAFGDLALTPDSGTSTLLPARLGTSISMKGVILAEILSAEYLLEHSAIDELVPNDAALLRAKELAMQYVGRDHWAMEHTKQLINHDIIVKIEKQCEREYKTIIQASSRDEFVQRMYAVLERMQKK